MREDRVGCISGMFLVTTLIVGCGGTTTATERHVDVADASTGGSRNGTGGGASSDGSVGGCGANGACGTDAAVDGSVSRMSCGELHDAWTAFWQGHQSCATDTDCIPFLAIDPASDPCGAPPGLNQAINGAFVGDARSYADRYFALACGGDPNQPRSIQQGAWSDFGFDGTALVNPRCVSGLCSADSLQCNPPPPFDGGPEAAPATSCPGSAGPAMVRVPAPDGTTYCIDTTEVTNAEYAQFLDSKGADVSGQDAACASNATYVPFDSWPATGRDEFPVVYVDFCDAVAYCKWAGKHLCGKIGGGANTDADFADPTKSQWFNACSNGGTDAYPYGSSYDTAACVGVDYDGASGFQAGSDVAHPVAAATWCHGTASPFDAIRDLSGNAAEWEDSCHLAGTVEQCRLRGGSFVHSGTALECGADLSYHPTGSAANIGIRCCAE